MTKKLTSKELAEMTAKLTALCSEGRGQVKDLLCELFDVETSEVNNRRVDLGSRYFVLDACEVHPSNEAGDTLDQKRLDQYCYFKTRKDAEIQGRRDRCYRELCYLADSLNKDYVPASGTERKQYVIKNQGGLIGCVNVMGNVYGVPTFNSIEAATKAIELMSPELNQFLQG